jgi:hypothetical protein
LPPPRRSRLIKRVFPPAVVICSWMPWVAS